MQFNNPAAQLQASAASIKLLLLDVDGVMTDGKLYYAASGEAFKVFHTLDGHGIKQLLAAGIEVGIITGRNTEILARRCDELGISLLYQGREDKLDVLQEILAQRKLDPAQVAYAGDDYPDLPVMQTVGLSFSVPNGHPQLIAQANAVTSRRGGDGAVREITDFLLDNRDGG